MELPKRVKRFKADFYTIEELKQLFDEVTGTNIEMPTLLTGYLGLRKSEALGLKWESIDWENETAEIKDTIVMNSGKCLCAENTKTSSGHRTVVIPEPLIEALRRELERQEKNRVYFGKSFIESGYVCTEPNGMLMRPDTYYKRFKHFLKAHGMKDIRVHDLRHTAGSLFLQSGFTVKEVGDQLGHSSVEVTNRYLHSVTQSKRAIADKMSALFSEKNNENVRRLCEVDQNIPIIKVVAGKEKTPQTPINRAFAR